jgi:hypothetical protein
MPLLPGRARRSGRRSATASRRGHYRSVQPRSPIESERRQNLGPSDGANPDTGDKVGKRQFVALSVKVS